MKLWGGRFTKETNNLVEKFNESLSFDQRFYKQDIRGSIAHVRMLEKQNIISKDEMESIVEGLTSIKNDIETGKLTFESDAEDIHSFVEANLIERIGEVGKKLHTGRSRNDQVALDMKLYVRDEIDEILKLLYFLMEEVLHIMEEHKKTYIPSPPIHLQNIPPSFLFQYLPYHFLVSPFCPVFVPTFLKSDNFFRLKIYYKNPQLLKFHVSQ